MEDMRVLVIEDNKRYSDRIVKAFQDLGANSVSTALTIGGAELVLFHESQVFDIIVIDACVPGDDYNTGHIIRRLRAMKSTAILVAASSLGRYRQAQLRDGCHIDGGPRKWEIPLVVSDALTPASAL